VTGQDGFGEFIERLEVRRCGSATCAVKKALTCAVEKALDFFPYCGALLNGPYCQTCRPGERQTTIAARS
jgi:hypothetical protein